MKLKPHGSNQTLLSLPNETEVLFSYSTPVAAFVPGEGYVRTEAHYSVTTSKHINAYAGKDATQKPQSFFDSLVA